MSSFSQRHGYSGPAKEITIREDAPESIRVVMLETAPTLGMSASTLRDIICRILRVRPDSNNWSAPNIWREVEFLVYDCAWFKVYDIMEAVHASFRKSNWPNAVTFETEMNTVFVEEGIGWQLTTNCQVISRGSEAFEETVKTASSELQKDGRPTASGQIHESLQALSRRPEPNFRGAIFHGMGALECVLRDIAGDQKVTLGEALKHYPNLIPKPVDDALSKLWGYASNEARHVEEGREPKREDAELIVGLAATIATYLTRKQRAHSIQ
jgi:hypothetical protein